MHFLLCLLFAFVSAQSCFDRPNIVLLYADDMGKYDNSWDINTLYDSSLTNHNTPNLQNLALNGMVFNRSYTYPQCATSRNALLTGMYPTNPGNGVQSNTPEAKTDGTFNQPLHVMQNTETYLGQTMLNAGYRTCFIGKGRTSGMTFVDEVDHLLSGFEEFYAGGSANPPRLRQYNTSLVNNPYLDGIDLFYKSGVINKIYDGQDDYTLAELEDILLNRPKMLTDALEEAFRKCVNKFRQETPNSPFFIDLSFYAPHGPWVGSSREDVSQKYPYDNDGQRKALIEMMDQAIGRIMNFLTSKNLLESTLVVFSSDNGPPSDYSPQQGSKANYFENGIQTPLIAHMPNCVPVGTTNEVVHVTDMYPTFAELAGVDPTTLNTDGASFLNLLQSTTATRFRRIWYHMSQLDHPYSILYNNQKYKVWYGYRDMSFTIYDLLAAPHESTNITSLLLDNKKFQLCNFMLEYLVTIRNTDQNWLTYVATGEKVELPDCTRFCPCA